MAACSVAGIADHVEITEGEKGLPKVVLRHSCGAKAEVKLLYILSTSPACPSTGMHMLATPAGSSRGLHASSSGQTEGPASRCRSRTLL